LRYEISKGFLEALIGNYFAENHYTRLGLLLKFLLRRTPMSCKKGTIVLPKSRDIKLLDHKMSLKVINYCATWTNSYFCCVFEAGELGYKSRPETGFHCFSVIASKS